MNYSLKEFGELAAAALQSVCLPNVFSSDFNIFAMAPNSY